MKKRHHILIWLSVVLSAFALVRTFMWFPAVRVHEEKSAEYAASANTYLRNCLRELTRNGDLVHFHFPNKSYGIMQETIPDPSYPDMKYPVWTGEFDLKVGESFKHRPDHHLTSCYTLKAIEPTGIIIEYETRFDHRSFGKNLINVDRGELRIHWKQPEANNELNPTNGPAASDSI